MQLYIKNMVCDRCKMVVKTELDKLGFNPISVELGEVEIKQESLNRLQEEELKISLQNLGFELLIDRKSQIVEQIKTVIIGLVHYPAGELKINLSAYLSQQLDLEYANLSAIFSEKEHQTIEKYFIAQKIEKVKELLADGEKSLSEIAYHLNYSSVAHLSSQFKKVNGQTPSAYKLRQNADRKTLDKI